MISALLLALLASTDPCAPASPLPPDAATAQVYREIGDGHRQAGELHLAAIAYREALRRAPQDAALQRSLEAVCRPSPSAFEQGQAKLQRGDLLGAVPLLEQARREGDASATLLEGIALFQLGREAQAQPLLAEAAGDPSLRNSAEFFLGLIALHQGDRTRAVALFDSARGDPALTNDALELRNLAQSEGRLHVSLLAQSLYDTNPTLLPTAAVQGGKGDVGFSLAGLLLYQPWGPSGPYARLSTVGTAQVSYSDFNFASGAGSLGWRTGKGGAFALGEYTFSYAALGQSPYLVAHQLFTQGQVAPGRWLLGATYSAQSRSFQTANAQPYSGWLQRAHGYVGYRFGDALLAFTGYRVTRDSVTLPELSYLEHAPWAELRLFLSPRARLVASGDYAWRGYDALDPQLAILRSDRVLEGSAAAELDLDDHFTVRFTAGGSHQRSNVPDFNFDAVTLGLGLQYTAGFF